MDEREITIFRLAGQDRFVSGRKLTLSADEFKVTGSIEEFEKENNINLNAVTDLTFVWPHIESENND